LDSSSFTLVGSEYELLIGASQLSKTPGLLFGEFQSDTELDPTVKVLQDMDNDTTFAWTDYHITVYMESTFSLAAYSAPVGWTTVITGPTGGQPLPSGGTGWVGMVDYYIGTGDPVAIGDSAIFGYKLTFTGTVQYCTQQYPTPEPMTLGLLGFGALALMQKRRS
jgi:hypothetical protein